MRPQLYILTTVLLGSLFFSGKLQAQLDPAVPDLNLPDFNNTNNSVIGNLDTPAIRRQLYRSIRRSRPVVEDAELSEWLNHLVTRLAVHAPGVGNSLLAVISNDPAINAYVLTGGVIVVNSGLILGTSSESEVAAVLAHEIAHVSQNHLARMQYDQKNRPLLTGLGILAGAVAAGKNPEAAQAIISGTIAIQAQQQISYSQQYEAEADRVGLRILSQARFDPQGMTRFLEKLERNENNSLGNLGKYLRSHPLSIDRLSDARTRAARLGNNSRESIDYLFAREKLRVLHTPGHYAPTAGLPATVNLYQQALQQYKRDNYPAVLKLLPPQPTQLAAIILRARSLNDLRRFAESEQQLNRVQGRYPHSTALKLQLARAIAGRGDPARAWQLLRRIPTPENVSLEFFDIAQHVAQQAGQHYDAILYSVERNLRLGEYRYARLTLEQQLRGNPPAHTRVQLQQKLGEIRQAESELRYLKR